MDLGDYSITLNARFRSDGNCSNNNDGGGGGDIRVSFERDRDTISGVIYYLYSRVLVYILM